MTEFRRANACANSGCVEVAFDKGSVLVRGTRDDHVLQFSQDEWAAFLTGVRAGEFDWQYDPAAG